MAANDNCKKCEFNICGKPNNSSDICDECQHDPDVGWGGYTDGSDPDEETNHHYF